MGKFGTKRGNSQPAISTASLPDIIFMLLFFFMVVTVMRDGSQKVSVVTPGATELTKLEKKSLINHILIGKPMEQYQKQYGTKPRIQLGDKIASIKDIPRYVAEHYEKTPEGSRVGIKTSLKVDRDVTMGIVSDVKTELRKANALSISYTAKKRAE